MYPFQCMYPFWPLCKKLKAHRRKCFTIQNCCRVASPFFLSFIYPLPSVQFRSFLKLIFTQKLNNWKASILNYFPKSSWLFYWTLIYLTKADFAIFKNPSIMSFTKYNYFHRSYGFLVKNLTNLDQPLKKCHNRIDVNKTRQMLESLWFCYCCCFFQQIIIMVRSTYDLSWVCSLLWWSSHEWKQKILRMIFQRGTTNFKNYWKEKSATLTLFNN